MRYFGTAAILVAVLLVAAGMVVADRVEQVSEVVSAEGADRLEVELDFGAGELLIMPEDIEEAAKLDIYYTPRWVRYDIDYQKRGETGHLFLETSHRGKSVHSDSENEWRLVLSNRYRTRLEMDIGACETEIDLGGIPLTELQIDMGASSGVIDFSRPNPERLRELDIEAGASSLEITNLANANAEEMSFSIGAASCELDLRGDLRGVSDIDLEVGVGSVDIIVQRGLAVRVESDDGWFSSVDFHGMDLYETRDGVWETDNFDDARDRLTIRADVAMGSIDIYAKR
jgi:hypothetical protein